MKIKKTDVWYPVYWYPTIIIMQKVFLSSKYYTDTAGRLWLA